MMRGLAFASALSVAALPAAAEAVRVYSGEHEDFSRVVAVFGQPTGWSQRRTDDGYEVAFDRPGLSLDLERVFERMPRTRIASVTFDPANSVLRITSACACALEVFEAGQNTIAMDVRDGPIDPTQAKAETPESPSAVFPFGVPAAFDEIVPLADTAPFAIGRFVVGGTTGPQAASPGVEAHLRSMEVELYRQLGRAATQGVAHLAPESGIAGHAGNDRTAPDGAVAERHLKARTVFDELAPGGPASAASTPDASACPGPDVLDAAGWITAPDLGRSIATARQALFGEFDRPEPANVRALVQAYLAFGFGAEARAVIRELGDDLPQRHLYLGVASVVDGDPPPDPSLFSAALDCSGPMALWAYAATGGDGDPGTANLQMVQVWFNRLPDPLRIQLGPRLVESLAGSGHDIEATAIRESFLRTEQAPLVAIGMVDAARDLAQGDAAGAEARLAGIVAASVPASPDAMVRLLASTRGKGMADPETILTAEALAFEFRDSQTGVSLLEEAALAWAALSDFASARRVLDELSSMPRPIPDPVLTAVVEEMIDREADGTLLEFVVSERYREAPESLSREGTFSLAGWLLENGMNAAAEQALRPYREDNALVPRRLRARLALARGEPALALSLVSAEPDSESAELRRQALVQLKHRADAAESAAPNRLQVPLEDGSVVALGPGETSTIGELFIAAELPAPLLQSGLAGLPDADTLTTSSGLGEENTRVISGFAATGTAASGGADAITLSRGQEMIDASKAARAAIASLLEETQLPDAASETRPSSVH